ncbi:MAG: GNAT family N-acetyltransferase [Phycisphaerales bacterium]
MEIRDLALLEESRLVVGMAEISDHTLPIKSGGVACRATPGWWNNVAVGLGMNGPVAREELEEMAAWYESAGIEPRVEVCPLADMSLLKECESLRFAARNFDNVLYREISKSEKVVPAQPADPAISIRIVDRSNEADVRAWGRISMTGSRPADVVIPEQDYELSSRVVKHPRTYSFIASIRDSRGTHDAGAGALELHGEIASLFGLSTLHAFRKRGIQQSLIAARLNLASANGAMVATICSRPGAGTERNVRRMGFQTAYTKVILTRAGPNLIASRG